MLVTKSSLIGKRLVTDDAFDVYAYLLNVDTGDTIELINFTQAYQASTDFANNKHGTIRLEIINSYS